MRNTVPDTYALTGTTILAALCLAVLLGSYVAIGMGLMRLVRVELPSAVRSHMVRF